jgi:hypothetical protein
MTSAGGGWPVPAMPAEDTATGASRAASRADSKAAVMTDRHRLAVHNTSIRVTGDIQSL